MAMGLTTGLWVSAQVRLCDRAFIPAAVVRRGDPDAGTVLLKINRFEAGVTVYTQASTMDDEPAWSRGTGPTPVSEPTLALMRRIDELHLQYPFAGDVAALALGLLLLGPPPVEQMVGIPRFCATWTTGCRDS